MFFSKKNLRNKLHPKISSFFCLNAAQFLGALNDNIYKLLTIFLLISTLGVENSSKILSAVGALYVIPFLLFSSAAGIWADRISKQKLIVLLKAVEVILMVLSLVVFSLKNILGSYILLFLVATHSAIFGPSKYGIIPELVEKQSVPKANGLLTSFTYLAIILGTFLASFLTEFTQKNYVICVGFCLLFSIIGFIFSLGIKKTEAQKSLKKAHVFFPKEIIQTILECRKTPLLSPCLFGSAFFLFIGAFTQLNIIPFAIESLHLSEYAGGYLFLLSALGIASGSLLTGKLLKKKAELGLSCLAGFGISLIFFLLWLFSSFLIPTAFFLVLLGFTGGIFVVSFDSFIQTNSASEVRGQTIATANFLSFFGVLIASFALYLFGHVMGISPSAGFFCIGLLTFLVSFFLTARLLQTSLPFFARFFQSSKIPNEVVEDTQIFVSTDLSWPLLWKALTLSTNCQIFIQNDPNQKIPLILRIAPNVTFLHMHTSLEDALKKTKTLLKDGCKGYLFHKNAFLIKQMPRKKSLFSFDGENIGLLSFQEIESKTALHIEKYAILL